MASAKSRLTKLAGHFVDSSSTPAAVPPGSNDPLVIDGHARGTSKWFNYHSLTPTFFLPRAAAIEPDALAIYHKTADDKLLTKTYSQFARKASDFAYYLKKHRYRRIGILCPNTPAFLYATFAANAADGVVIPVNYRLKPDDISYIFQHSDADFILVDAEFAPLLDNYRAAKPHVRILIDDDAANESGAFGSALAKGAAYDLQHGNYGWEGLTSLADDELAVNALTYTSGTTGRPKGVEYTHRGCYMSALGNIIESGLVLQGTRRSKYLWIVPMFHAMGWTFPWAVTAARGTHYCMRKIDYPYIWKLLREEEITHFCAAPTVNTLLCADPSAQTLKQEVRVIVGASPPTAHLFQSMTGLNLHPVHVYGSTETYAPITRGYDMPAYHDLPVNEMYGRLARQGHGFITSLPVQVIKTGDDVAEGVLVDVKKDGKEIGEVVFSGNICARGYYKDEMATRKLFAGGALHSGDLAVWHPDGAIQIMDRTKDIIISGGENISSVALEAAIVTHPDILECGICAIRDEHWGERPKAFITLKTGRTITNKDFIEWCRGHPAISRFMVPKECEVVDELPKTSTGKIRKNVLRQWAEGDRSEGSQ
ncbi:fatty-acyl-CoA synthase [Exophiala viscosa]|uniref:fatty-acyl-CoA synthase n=1 Tax=Exophiala viscosa TaxID=2486360 RepID=UPI00218F4918|nr:fatty-acyl-CoA synthase [Exophiala viscosa]